MLETFVRDCDTAHYLLYSLLVEREQIKFSNHSSSATSGICHSIAMIHPLF